MKNNRKSSGKTRVFKVINFGKRFRLRIPSFVSTPLLVLIGIILLLIVLFPFTRTVQQFDLPKAGEAAKETIIAPITYDILRSPDEVERERKKAMEQILQVVDYDDTIAEAVLKQLDDLRRTLTLVAAKDSADSIAAQRLHSFSRELSDNALAVLRQRPFLIEDVMIAARDMLDKGVSAVLLVSSMERLTELRTLYNTSFDQHLLYKKQYVTLRRDSSETTLRVSDLPVKEIALENAIKRLRVERKLDDEALNAIYELLFVYVRPNVKINGELTVQRQHKASQEVLEISGKVIKDTEIIRKHQEVTPEVIRKLKSLRYALDKMVNVQEKRKIAANNVGRWLIVMLPLLFAAFYISRYQKRLVRNDKHLIALAIILCLQVAFIRGSMALVPRLFEGSSEMTMLVPEYIIPLTMGSILTAILFTIEVSFIFTLFISIFFGCVTGFNHYYFIFALLSGIIAGFSARNIRYRWHFFKIIPSVVLICIVIITLWHLISFKLSLLSLLINFSLALISVIISIFSAMMLTTVFEHLFDITTDMTLVELSDLNHPVLKRLSIEAAGTYNHSVLVGNLAESAAQRIGANSLFARVASYYHDIGKIEKSDYFVENCLTVDRTRHTKLAPSMSALIICSHVKDGVELARKYHVPKSIQDVIMQHHGTSMVSFFYEKALEQDPHKQVQEQEFRYAGPVPQTRESAIIMLADSVEAASRSLGTSSPKLLRDLVKKIIRDKFLSSQLDQCDLTLRDLDEIVEGFMPVLQGIFHSRIEYPSKDKEQDRDAKK
ncbi:MAG: HDIG domain-containing protein [Chitinispirillaceae bacterium]|nr:HDIG domain-containing protein [Chitinispirillaceae bacterium]